MKEYNFKHSEWWFWRSVSIAHSCKIQENTPICALQYEIERKAKHANKNERIMSAKERRKAYAFFHALYGGNCVNCPAGAERTVNIGELTQFYAVRCMAKLFYEYEMNMEGKAMVINTLEKWQRHTSSAILHYHARKNTPEWCSWNTIITEPYEEQLPIPTWQVFCVRLSLAQLYITLHEKCGEYA